MFNLTIKDEELLKTIFTSLKDVLTDIDVAFSTGEDVMSFNTMDTSHVMLVVMNTKNDFFVKKEVKENIIVRLSTIPFVKILGLCNNDHKLKMSCDEKMENLNVKYGNKTVNLKLLEPIDEEKIAVPVIDYQCQFQLTMEQYEDLLKSFKSLGDDNLTISLFKDKVVFSSSNDSTSTETVFHNQASSDEVVTKKAKIEKKKKSKDEHLKNYICENEMKIKLSTKYFGFMCVKKLGTTVTFSFSDGRPVCVNYDFGGGSLTFYLAPKIEDDP